MAKYVSIIESHEPQWVQHATAAGAPLAEQLVKEQQAAYLLLADTDFDGALESSSHQSSATARAQVTRLCALQAL